MMAAVAVVVVVVVAVVVAVVVVVGTVIVVVVVNSFEPAQDQLEASVSLGRGDLEFNSTNQNNLIKLLETVKITDLP